MSDRDWSAYAKSTYQWEPGHEKMLRITKSSLTSDFDFCPKQYEYKRVHRLPTPSTDAMIKGTNIHDAIEAYYNSVLPILDELHTLVQRNKMTEAMELAKSVLPDKDYELNEQPSIDMRLFWDLHRLKTVGKELYLPIINESEIHAYTEEEIEFNGEVYTIPVHYAGSIDRGFSEEDGSVAIMELKTGKWVQTKRGDDWKDSDFKVKSMRREMAFYKMLLEIADHEFQDVTHWGWVYPSGVVEGMESLNKYGYEQRSINKIFYEKITKRMNTSYNKSIQKLKSGLLTAYLSKDFPTSASAGKCAWCDFKSICPAWEGSDNPQEYLDNYKEE